MDIVLNGTLSSLVCSFSVELQVLINDIWMNTSSWSSKPSGSVTGRSSHACAYNPQNGQFFAHGGKTLGVGIGSSTSGSTYCTLTSGSLTLIPWLGRQLTPASRMWHSVVTQWNMFNPRTTFTLLWEGLNYMDLLQEAALTCQRYKFIPILFV